MKNWLFIVIAMFALNAFAGSREFWTEFQRTYHAEGVNEALGGYERFDEIKFENSEANLSEYDRTQKFLIRKLMKSQAELEKYLSSPEVEILETHYFESLKVQDQSLVDLYYKAGAQKLLADSYRSLKSHYKKIRRWSYLGFIAGLVPYIAPDFTPSFLYAAPMIPVVTEFLFLVKGVHEKLRFKLDVALHPNNFDYFELVSRHREILSFHAKIDKLKNGSCIRYFK